MSYFNDYVTRLSSNGSNTGQSLTNNTTNFINSYFDSSSTYRKITAYTYRSGVLNSVEMDCRVVKIERMGTLRELLLRPNENLDIGVYIKLDDEVWVVYDKYGGENNVSIKVIVSKCNKILRWKDKNDKINEYYCIASASDIGSKSKQSKSMIEWNKFDVSLPLGQLFIFVESTPDTRGLYLNYRFILGSNVYEVIGMDDVTNVDENNNGLIQMTAKIATRRDTDDFVNGFADNTYEKNNDSGEIGDNGGKLW